MNPWDEDPDVAGVDEEPERTPWAGDPDVGVPLPPANDLPVAPNAVDQSPETAARDRELARASGLPQEAVAGDREIIERGLKLRQLEQMAERNPALARVLADPGTAPLAQDDGEALNDISTIWGRLGGALERGWLSAAQIGPSISATMSGRILTQIDDVRARLAAGEQVPLGEDPWNVQGAAEWKVEHLRKRRLAHIGTQSTYIARREVEKLGTTPLHPDVVRAMQAKGAAEFFSAFLERPFEFIASVGAESLPASAPGLVAAAFLSATGMGPASVLAVGVGSGLADYSAELMQGLQDAGVDTKDPKALAEAIATPGLMDEVGAKAMTHALAVAAFDTAGGGAARAVASAMSRKGLGAQLKHAFVQQQIQGASGALGEIAGTALQGEVPGFGEVAAEYLGELATAPVEVPSVMVDILTDRHERRRGEAVRAQRTEALVQSLIGGSEASRLRARDSEVFRAYVRDVTDDGDGAPVDAYVDAQAFNQFVSPQAVEQARQTAPDTVAELERQLAAVQEAGGEGDIVMPLADLVTAFAGTDGAAALAQHVRSGEMAMSAAEAAVFSTVEAEAFQQVMDEIATRTEEQAAQAADQDAVYGRILARLTAAQTPFGSRVDAVQARIPAALIQTMAARQGVPALDFAARWVPNIVYSPQQPTGGQVLRSTDDVNFRNWFRESKAVALPDGVTSSRDGRKPQPQRMFHTTRNAFSAFEVGRPTVNSGTFGDEHTFRNAIFVTPDAQASAAYGTSGGEVAPGANTQPVYIRAEDPLDLTDGVTEADEKRLLDAGLSSGFVHNRLSHWSALDGEEGRALVETLKAAGYDSVVLNDENPDTGETFESWAVFEPEQIKSVFNDGAWSPANPDTLRQPMSTRLPTGKTAMENALDALLTVDYRLVAENAQTASTVVQRLRGGIPGFRKLAGKGSKNPAAQLEAIVEQMADNLFWLYEGMDPAMRERAQLWYDGGNRLVKAWSQRYGISEMQGAAAIAVLSPQTDWFQNLSRAERLADIVFRGRGERWTAEMSAFIASRDSLAGSSVISAAARRAEGKTLGELLASSDLGAAAVFVRAYDTVYNSRAFAMATPEGGIVGPVRTAAGRDAELLWANHGPIVKAISVLTDGRAENVHYQLGGSHKVRNFYNNLFDPNNPSGFVTVDTHAVAAATLMPYASSSPAVVDAFSGVSAVSGQGPVYAVYAEAYRRAAERAGTQPRQLQSIAWEEVRRIFEGTRKSALMAPVRSVWGRFEAGEIDLEQARAEIAMLAGRQDPAWAQEPFDTTIRPTYAGPLQALPAEALPQALDAPPVVNFEVAPDPNNAALTAQWDALSLEDQQAISSTVVAAILPDVLRELGATGAVGTQLGGYLGATNPSLALAIEQGQLSEAAAKLLGYVLRQDSMMVVSSTPVLGASPTGAVFIKIGEGVGVREVTQLYDRLWTLEHNGEKLVGGHTTDNGVMAIMNFSDLSSEELAARINAHLNDAFDVGVGELHVAFIDNEAYNYAGSEDGTGAGVSRRANQLRDKATAVLEAELAKRSASPTSYAQTERRPGAYPSATPVGSSPAIGYHFSRQPRSVIDGRFYGTGMKGKEVERVMGAPDARLRERVYVYLDDGQGVEPEVSVGAYAHEVVLPTLYDGRADPLSIRHLLTADISAWETALLDNGYHGYYTALDDGSQNAAVIIGPASRAVPVKRAQPQLRSGRPAGTYTPPPPPQAYQGPGRYWTPLTMDSFRKLDMDAIREVAPSAVVFNGVFSVDEAEIAAARGAAEKMGVSLPDRSLNQGREERALGDYTPATNTIRLFAGMNFSTFLHETGHMALEMMVEAATQYGAPQQVVEDTLTLLNFAGVDSIQTWQDMTFEERRPHHEIIAGGFETYLMEGRAPSKALERAFAAIKDMLFAVYKALKNMNVQINDEVRGVFDRMLASEAEIEAKQAEMNAQPMFTSAEDAGMTVDQWKDYQAVGATAAADALNRLRADSIADMKWLSNAKSAALRKLQATVAELRKGLRAEVEAELDRMPVYQALAFLTRGEMIDRDLTNAQRKVLAPMLGGKTKLDAAALKGMYGDAGNALWRFLPRNTIVNEGGVSPEAVATLFGFDSADALVRAVLSAEDRTALAEAMVDRRMVERHSELASDEAVERRAEEAIMNRARTRMVAHELRALQDAMNPRAQVGETTIRRGRHKGQTRAITINALVRAASQYADKTIDGMIVRRLAPGSYRRTAAKVAALAAKARAAGNLEEAIQYKRSQLLHTVLAQRAQSAREQFAKDLKYLRRFRDIRKHAKRVDGDYLERIQDILSAIDTRARSEVRQRSLDSLKKWMAEQEAAGIPVALDADLLQELQTTNVRELTVRQMRDLTDQIKMVEHIGKMKKKLLLAKDQREFEQIRDGIVATIEKHGGKAKPVPFNPSSQEALRGGRWRRFLAEHRRVSSLVRQMEGGENGVFWNALMRTMNDAGDRETVLNVSAAERMDAILTPLTKLPGGMRGDRRHIVALDQSLSREERLVFALNWGNETSRERVTDMIGEQAIGEILRTLSAQELEAVNEIWSFVDEFWPDLAAKEKRVFGLAPDKVEAIPFEVVLPTGETVQMRGGYYPLAYEAAKSDKAAANLEAQRAKDMIPGAYGRRMSRRGHAKSRQEHTGLPIKLSLSVLGDHVRTVIHDISWHEWLIDAYRLLHDPQISTAIREHYGQEVLATMRQSVSDIAIGELRTASTIDEVALVGRTLASISAMGASLTVAFLQPFGIINSGHRIGWRWVLAGLRRWAGDAAKLQSGMKEIGTKSAFMRMRARTFNRELVEVLGRVQKGGTGLRQKFTTSLFLPLQKMQQIADIPTWYGAFEKALAQGHDESTAVALADQAVLDAQGGGQIKDLAGIQHRSTLGKVGSVFYSWMGATFNLLEEERGRAVRLKSPGAILGYAQALFMMVIVNALAPEIIKEAVRGEWDDDDYWDEKFARRRLEDVGGFALGLMVGLREASGLVQGYEYHGPAFTRAIIDVWKSGEKTWNVAFDEDTEFDDDALRLMIKGFFTAAGLPSMQIDRTWRGWKAWAEGEAGPGAVLFGPPEKD